MTNEVENLILEHLRALRTGHVQFKASLAELKSRMLSIESQIAATTMTEVRHSSLLD